jgi:hypothetical protein
MPEAGKPVAMLGQIELLLAQELSESLFKIVPANARANGLVARYLGGLLA